MRKREIEVWRKNTLALAVVVAASSEKLKFFAGEPEICRFTLTQHQNFHTRLLLLVFKNCGITTSNKQRERKREKWSIYDTNKPEQGWISQQATRGSFVFFSSLSFLWWHSNLIIPSNWKRKISARMELENSKQKEKMRKTYKYWRRRRRRRAPPGEGATCSNHHFSSCFPQLWRPHFFVVKL